MSRKFHLLYLIYQQLEPPEDFSFPSLKPEYSRLVILQYHDEGERCHYNNYNSIVCYTCKYKDIYLYWVGHTKRDDMRIRGLRLALQASLKMQFIIPVLIC